MLFRGVGIGEKPPRCYFSNGGNAMKNNRNFLMGTLLTVCGLLLILCTVLLFTGRSKPADSTVELPEVRNNGTAIQWKTGSGNEWHDLVSLDTLRGADGEKGADGSNGKDGIDGKDGAAGKTGKDGADGRSIEVERTDSDIRWRYEGGEWQNLVSLADLRGPSGSDGRTPEFRVDGNLLQWRYCGSEV